MSSKSNVFENDLLLLLFNNVNIANIGDAGGVRGSVAPGQLFLSLHSADPGEGGDQTTSEIAYTGYARVGVARSGAGFVVTGNSVSPAANVDFGPCTALPSTYMYWALGTAASGAGKILYKGVIGANLGGFTALATDVITIPGLTGVAVNDNIAFFPAPGDTLPAGVTEGTVYFVRSVSGNDITLSLTSGGAVVDITGPGKGRAARLTPKVMTVGDIPRIPTTTTIVED
ncbi:hypothetical protein [Tabrizicola sp.]|uniref:phage tail fiber protein n=1 Tax=Tabrizicola sp. TaxID=2005166 RepID=UPI0025D3894A|nr:hypothetical protein [Tabrizicola sp.]